MHSRSAGGWKCARDTWKTPTDNSAHVLFLTLRVMKLLSVHVRDSGGGSRRWYLAWRHPIPGVLVPRMSTSAHLTLTLGCPRCLDVLTDPNGFTNSVFLAVVSLTNRRSSKAPEMSSKYSHATGLGSPHKTTSSSMRPLTSIERNCDVITTWVALQQRDCQLWSVAPSTNTQS